MNPGVYQPLGSHVHCDFCQCFYGMGLVGSGRCDGHGLWWMPCCPAFEDIEEVLRKWRERE